MEVVEVALEVAVSTALYPCCDACNIVCSFVKVSIVQVVLLLEQNLIPRMSIVTVENPFKGGLLMGS